MSTSIDNVKEGLAKIGSIGIGSSRASKVALLEAFVRLRQKVCCILVHIHIKG